MPHFVYRSKRRWILLSNWADSFQIINELTFFKNQAAIVSTYKLMQQDNRLYHISSSSKASWATLPPCLHNAPGPWERLCACEAVAQDLPRVQGASEAEPVQPGHQHVAVEAFHRVEGEQGKSYGGTVNLESGAGHFGFVKHFFNNKKWSFEFFIKLIRLGVGFI